MKTGSKLDRLKDKLAPGGPDALDDDALSDPLTDALGGAAIGSETKPPESPPAGGSPSSTDAGLDPLSAMLGNVLGQTSATDDAVEPREAEPDDEPAEVQATEVRRLPTTGGSDDPEITALQGMTADEIDDKFGIEASKSKMIADHLETNTITKVADLQSIKGIGKGTTKKMHGVIEDERTFDPVLNRVNTATDADLRSAGLDDDKITLIRTHIETVGPIEVEGDLQGIHGIGDGTVRRLRKALK